MKEEMTLKKAGNILRPLFHERNINLKSSFIITYSQTVQVITQEGSDTHLHAQVKKHQLEVDELSKV